MVFNYYPILLSILYGAILWGTLRKNNIFLVVIAILSIAVFFGFRGPEAGADTHNYVGAFKSIPDTIYTYRDLTKAFVLNNITAAEPGFVLFTYLNKLVGFSADFFLVTVALWGLIFTYLAYRRLSDYPLLAFSLYSVSMTCVSLHSNVIRQGMAVGIVLLGISFIQQERKKLAFFLFVFASFFHFSALLVAIFLIPAVFRFKMRYFWGAMLVLIALLLSGFFSSVIFMFLPKLLAIKAAKYFHVGMDSLITFKFLSFFIFVAFLEFIKTFGSYNREIINNLYRCYFSLFLIQLLFIGDLVASERFGLYRFALEPIIIIYAFNSWKEQHLSRLSLALIAILYGLVVFNIPTIQETLT
ncbi:EpsG family protein [Thalassomonas actiniarum]|uniref:EpsG family protein n=1 Tax=Thalassomonas actiniarum TaxID=485447 RepID=A0AAE9YVX9_9GAMM|nr:EpsG family protein [Thalassomonas actiniarum]WDE00542.1 EpsG family protein [Thalassomonas actiniarum]